MPDVPSSPPPGWYPDGRGRTRWWSGRGWTEHVQGAAGTAAPPAAIPRPGRAPRTRSPHLGPVLVATASGLLVLAAGLLQGMPGLAWSIGLLALVAGVVALARGSLRLLRIRNRAAAAAVLVAGIVVWAGGVAATAAPRSADRQQAAATAAAPPARTVTPAASGSASATASPTASPTRSAATATPQAGTALALLATLPVKGRAPMTGYARTADFGTAWLDVDRNGCDTRNDVLRRDLVATTGSGCRVLTGVLHDPYTGRTIDFLRGAGTSTAVQIDHVVSLGDAWQTGAQRLSQAQRVDLANDPINLFAVDGPTNEQKGDGDTATWLPPVRAFRCTYVAHQVSVKAAYGLWVTAAEKAAMARILGTCPTQRAVRSAVSHVVLPVAASAPSSTASSSASAPTGGSGTYYASCAAVRAAGRAPLHRGDPGYRSGLDRDGDGVACERTSGGSTSSGAGGSSGSTTTGGPSGGDAYYASCSAARAAGAAPLHRGDPGYRSGLDRDGDGVACE